MNIRRDIIGALTPQTVDIPGRRGNVYEGTNIGAKTFEIECLMLVDSEEDRIELSSELANLVAQMSDGNLYQLRFGDEPETFYWVHPTGVSQAERIGETNSEAVVTLSFSAPEGVGYKDLEEYTLTSNITPFTSSGNAPTPAIFILNTEEKLKEIAVSNGEDYVHIGRNVAQPAGLLYLDDKGNSLTPWVKLSSSTIPFEPQDGVVANNAEVYVAGAGGHKFAVSTFGSNPNGVGDRKWYGPARRRNLSKKIQDFEISMSVEFFNYYQRAFNKIELYMLDDLGQRIGKLYIKDEGVSRTNVIGIEIYNNGEKHQVGTNTGMGLTKTTAGSNAKRTLTIKRALKDADVAKGEQIGEVKSKKYALIQSDTKNVLTNFTGTIGLRKVGNVYTASIQYMDSKGKPYGKLYTQTFTDRSNKYGQALAGMAMYFGKMNIYEDEGQPPIAYKGNGTYITGIRTKELTPQGKAQEAYVAEPGDEIIIDMGNKKIYKNGSVYMEDLNIGSQFFSLKPQSTNMIAVEPKPGLNNIWNMDINPRNS